MKNTTNKFAWLMLLATSSGVMGMVHENVFESQGKGDYNENTKISGYQTLNDSRPKLSPELTNDIKSNQNKLSSLGYQPLNASRPTLSSKLIKDINSNQSSSLQEIDLSTPTQENLSSNESFYQKFMDPEIGLGGQIAYGAGRVGTGISSGAQYVGRNALSGARSVGTRLGVTNLTGNSMDMPTLTKYQQTIIRKQFVNSPITKTNDENGNKINTFTDKNNNQLIKTYDQNGKLISEIYTPAKTYVNLPARTISYLYSLVPSLHTQAGRQAFVESVSALFKRNNPTATDAQVATVETEVAQEAVTDKIPTDKPSFISWLLGRTSKVATTGAQTQTSAANFNSPEAQTKGGYQLTPQPSLTPEEEALLNNGIISV